MGTMVSPTPVTTLLYQLQPTRPLPRIDNSKCVKHAILSPRAQRLFNRFTAATGKFLGLSFLVGMALCAASLVTLSPIAGVYLALVSSPLLLVPTCVALLVLRLDIVTLLLTTYEFWYMALMNVVVCVFVSLSLADARWLVVFSVGVAFQLALLIDANFRATKAAVWATVLGAMLNMGYVFSSMFGYLRNHTELTLFHYKQRTLLADDALMNVLGTLCVLMVRNAYRKRHQYAHSPGKRPTHTQRVTCIMYRCRLVLRPVSAATNLEDRKHSIVPSAVNTDLTSASVAPCPPATRSNTIPLEFAQDNEYYSVVDVCSPRVAHYLPVSMCWQLHAASVVSLASTFVAILSLDASLVFSAAVISSCGAAIVFIVYVSFAQRRLLARQLLSFDFLFLSVQLSIIHACLADTIGWSNPRVLVVVSSWLWMHWVLLVDTVLPIHKARLGYRPCVTVFVLLLFVAQQTAVFIAIVFYGDSTDRRLALRDRELFVLSLHGRVRQVRVVPVLFGRMVTTLSWSLRLLWRLMRVLRQPNWTVGRLNLR